MAIVQIVMSARSVGVNIRTGAYADGLRRSPADRLAQHCTQLSCSIYSNCIYVFECNLVSIYM